MARGGAGRHPPRSLVDAPCARAASTPYARLNALHKLAERSVLLRDLVEEIGEVEERHTRLRVEEARHRTDTPDHDPRNPGEGFVQLLELGQTGSRRDSLALRSS